MHQVNYIEVKKPIDFLLLKSKNIVSDPSIIISKDEVLTCSDILKFCNADLDKPHPDCIRESGWIMSSCQYGHTCTKREELNRKLGYTEGDLRIHTIINVHSIGIDKIRDFEEKVDLCKRKLAEIASNVSRRTGYNFSVYNYEKRLQATYAKHSRTLGQFEYDELIVFLEYYSNNKIIYLSTNSTYWRCREIDSKYKNSDEAIKGFLHTSEDDLIKWNSDIEFFTEQSSIDLDAIVKEVSDIAEKEIKDYENSLITKFFISINLLYNSFYFKKIKNIFRFISTLSFNLINLIGKVCSYLLSFFVLITVIMLIMTCCGLIK